MPQQSRKLLALAAFLALASENVSAFTPNSLNNNRAFPTALSAAGDDVSIDYDAAAKLAYDEWRNTFSKGDFSEDKFKAFKGNYEALTVANVKAAKKARETGTEATQKLELNEYADMTVEEFQKMQAGDVAEESADEPASPIKAAVDALEAQNVASSTLSEAAEALAKEEEKLAQELGLESVDELEVALDSMAGVAPDGGELDTTNISREARVRAAYMDWCKENGKESDEARFATFSSNYLAMEAYAKENGKTMQLNKYADCTEEEYLALTTAAKTEEKKEPVAEAPKEEKKEEEPAVDVSIPYNAAAMLAYEASDKKMDFAAFEKKYLADAVELVKSKKAAADEKIAAKKAPAPAPKVEKKEAAPAPAPKVEKKEAAPAPAAKAPAKKPVAKKAPAPAPAPAKKTAAEIEKEKQKRQADQEKARAAAAAEAEAAAIAAAREIAEKEAAQVAKRRELDAQAAELERQKAKKAAAAAPKPVSKPAPVEAKKEAPTPAPAKAEKKEPAPAGGIFGSIFGGAPKKPAAPKVDDSAAKAKAAAEAEAKAKAEAEAKAAAEAEAAKAKAAAEAEAAKAKAAAEAEAAKAKAAAEAAKKKEAAKPAAPLFGGFFAAEKKDTPPAPTPTPKPVAEPAAAKKVDIDVADPVSDAFASFFGTKSSTPVEEKAPEPKPVPAKAPTPAPAPAFGGFFGAKPAEAKKETPAPEKAAAAKAAQKTLESAPKKGGTISLAQFFTFGKKEVKPPPKPPVLSNWYKNNDGSITGEISGSTAFEEGELVTTSKIDGPATKDTVVTTVSGSRYFLDQNVGKKPFFLFGAPKGKAAEPPAPAPTPAPVAAKKPVAKKPVAKAPAPAPAAPAPKPAGFNFFGGAAKPAAPKAAPTAPAVQKTVTMKKPVAKAPAPAPATPKKPAGFNMFGGAAKPKAAAPAVQKTVAVQKPAAAQRRGTVTLGSAQAKSIAKKAAPVKNDGIPVLKNWKQEADGAITGNITNSKVFRNGQKITTSPVPKGAKAGSVVTTSSGSKYRLG